MPSSAVVVLSPFYCDHPGVKGHCKVASKVERYTYVMTELRLTCSASRVDVRLREINGRWIASADTPDGPSLGLGERAIDAVEQALKPFEGFVGELLASVPDARI